MITSINHINDILIEVNTDVSSEINFNKQLQIYFRILSEELLNIGIDLVTLKPQSYSLGYEISSDKELKKIRGKSFLFNTNLICNSETLLEILQSEEFRRGLLFIVKGMNNELEKVAEAIIQYYLDGTMVNYNAKGSLYFSEKDGNTLCLFNACTTKEEISSFIHSILQS